MEACNAGCPDRGGVSIKMCIDIQIWPSPHDRLYNGPDHFINHPLPSGQTKRILFDYICDKQWVVCYYSGHTSLAFTVNSHGFSGSIFQRCLSISELHPASSSSPIFPSLSHTSTTACLSCRDTRRV